MPYENEFADKSAHRDIIENPDVQGFLDEADYVREPSEAEGQRLASKFAIPPREYHGANLPDFVVAIDGSRHEAAITERLPSTRVGYVQVSGVLVSLSQYDTLGKGRFVDPFQVAKLKKGNDPYIFPLPSSNTRWGGHPTVRESFRAAIDRHLGSEITRFCDDERASSLRTTLFHIASRRPRLGTGDPREIIIPACPKCESENIKLFDVDDDQNCASCGALAFPSDALRLWEEVSEYAPNVTAITRFMNVVEHLLPVHLMRYLLERKDYSTLSGMSFVVDGPLALFGTVAPLHRGILSFIHDVNNELEAKGYQPVVVIGLQKSGHVVDHANLMERFLPRGTQQRPGRLLLVDDDYRYRRIVAREPSGNGFGFETHYGQDFIFHTPSGRTFVFALPLPKGCKAGRAEGMKPGREEYLRLKDDRDNYPTLPRALKLISHFESDLYRNAIVPVALAHKYTAISLRPGGRVLNLLTRAGMD